MRYVFHPEAETEFFAAIDYYEGREPGLGYDFAIEVHSTIDTILSFPHAWAIIEADIRRCQTRLFPMALSTQSTKTSFSFSLSCTFIETQDTGKID